VGWGRLGSNLRKKELEIQPLKGTYRNYKKGNFGILQKTSTTK